MAVYVRNDAVLPRNCGLLTILIKIKCSLYFTNYFGDHHVLEPACLIPVSVALAQYFIYACNVQ